MNYLVYNCINELIFLHYILVIFTTSNSCHIHCLYPCLPTSATLSFFFSSSSSSSSFSFPHLLLFPLFFHLLFPSPLHSFSSSSSYPHYLLLSCVSVFVARSVCVPVSLEARVIRSSSIQSYKQL